MTLSRRCYRDRKFGISRFDRLFSSQGHDITDVRNVISQRSECSRSLAISVYLFIVTAALTISTPSSAASFLYTPEELENAPAQVRAAQAALVTEVLASTRSVDGVIQIDDMLFREEDVLQRSGFTGTMWTNGEVFYTFDSAVTSQNRSRWLAAAADWAALADVTFTARTSEPNYIYIQNSGGNSSFVGMIGGSQDMNIASWDFEFIIAHEIGHALGLSHEQSRSDRDTYVTIFLANVSSGAESNFDILVTTNYGAYDFDSAMHYSKNTFSANPSTLNTIEPKAPYTAWLEQIGQIDHISVLDGDGMVQRYGSAYTKSTFLSFPMNSNPGWTTEDAWAFGVPTGGGSHGGDPTSFDLRAT